jgi:hypothetical protein
VSEKTFPTERLHLLLRRAFLGGLLEECVIEFGNDGAGFINAVDMSNSLFLSCSEPLLREGESIGGFERLGFGNLPLLCRFLADVAEADILVSREENRLFFKRSSGQGELRFLLTDPEVIPTTIEEQDVVESLLAQCVLSLPLTSDVCNFFSSYTGLIKTKAAQLTYQAKTGATWMIGGLKTEHQFELDFGTAGTIDPESDVPEEDFTVGCYGDFMSAVFQTLEFEEGRGQPGMLFSPGNPVVVVQDMDNPLWNMWALVPVEVQP